MSASRQIRPLLEILEERAVPTTAHLDGFGNLIVNSNTNVYLTVVDAFNDVDVKADNNSPPVTDLGTFPVTGNVIITQAASIANPGPQITFDLNGNDFTGNITVTAGNAAYGDTVNIGGPTNTGINNIFGNVSVTTGNNSLGGDFVGVGENSGVVINGALSVNTGAVTPPFSDIIATGSSFAAVAGNATLLNGTFVSLSSTSFGGSLKIDSHLQTLEPATVFLSGTTVNNNLTITTGSLSDFVFLDAATAVNGSATINLGNGGTPSGDDLDFAGTVLGNLTVQAGNGAEIIDLFGSSSTAIGNNLTVAVGSGQDSITLSGLTVLGNVLKVTAGNGNNLLQVDHLLAPGAAASFVTGAGSDTFSFDAGSIFVASLLLDGGFGVNHLIVTGGAWHFPTTLRHFS